jgi:hypothetical protein
LCSRAVEGELHRRQAGVDADRISIGGEDSVDSGELETRLLVAEFPVRQAHRPLR